MSDKITNILIVGVGGQGTLLASRVIAQAAIAMEYDVKVSEIHGMAQRGGSVVSQVRYGKKVFSPIIKKGEADVILAFEKVEAGRYLDFLKKDGLMLINNERIDPAPVMSGEAKYPELIEEKIAGVVPKTAVIDATRIAVECGNVKAANMVLVGLMSHALVLPKDTVSQAIKDLVPAKAVQINLAAMENGWNYLEKTPIRM